MLLYLVQLHDGDTDGGLICRDPCSRRKTGREDEQLHAQLLLERRQGLAPEAQRCDDTTSAGSDLTSRKPCSLVSARRRVRR